MGKFKNRKKGRFSSSEDPIEELPTPGKAVEVEGDDDDEEDEEEKVPKWYDEYPLNPPEKNPLPIDELTSLRIEAQNILEQEAKFYAAKTSKYKKGTNSSWMRTVLSKGTTKDRMAANVVIIQNSPIHSLPAINSLVNSVKAAKKKECILIMETLCDLFVEDLLRTGVKLRPFAKQPLSTLDHLTSGCSRSRRQMMAAWMFEDKLKESYANFIEAVNEVAKDTVDTNRIKAVTTLNKLLASHPEQEQLLLQHIINKLGDPSQKVVSKVIYCLTQLLRIHPNMKQIVLNEIEKLLFRPHISQKAQYYSICFLSQYVFSDKDKTLAKNIIEIYFSFFKALIKKAEVDTRMMGALLMGVKRAVPFAKMERDDMSPHIDTLYKLVHLSKFNIALHVLCLLQEVSGANEDRYYSALYKKLLDPAIGKSCHHAMLINLLYKALSKDKNTERVKAIVKRLFQLCFYFPVPVVCAMLFMISQLISKRRKLLFADTLSSGVNQLVNMDDDDGDEVYLDVDKPSDDGIKNDEGEETDVKKEEDDDEKKPLRGWVHYEFNKSSWASSNKPYDPFHRNPAFSNVDKTAFLELTQLAKHFHPTVALFINQILNGETIKYTGDPLSDFTLARFLERFVFKNPKNLDRGEKRGPDPLLASRKYYQPSGVRSLNVRSATYLDKDEKDIPVDELFLFRYLKEKHELRKAESDDDDNDSVASEDFEEMLDRMMGGKKKKKKEIDYMDEIGDSLKNNKKNLKGKESDEQDVSGSEGSDDDEADFEDGGDDMSDIDVDDEDDEDDDEVMDFEDAGDFEGDIDLKDAFKDPKEARAKKRKQALGEGKPSKKKKTGLESLFAPAEEFAEILEETGSSKQKPGMHSSVSNKENAAQKQLDWEKKRDMWVRNDGKFGKKTKSQGKWKGKPNKSNKHNNHSFNRKKTKK